MLVAASCVVKGLRVDGVMYNLEAYRAPRGHAGLRCGDCGVQPGGYHHLGCDMMRCPRCRRQLISCGCWDDGYEDDE
jgi:hypothetical protein